MEKTEYSMKEVSDYTNLSNDLIRLYQNEFNIQVERTKGGHRRFSKENIELLLAIKEKIQDQNWSYDQVRAWLNGERFPFKEQEVKSNLEKKLEKMLEEMEDFKESQEMLVNVNKQLVQRLEEQSKVFEEQRKVNTELLEIIKNQDNNILKLESNLESKIKSRDESVLKQIKEVQEEKKSKGFFQKLFSK
jgi:DNA-binding transcriptional MerR regulator